MRRKNATPAIRYGSVCSGIEAASVAWSPLDWSPAWFSEVDPFASEVLRTRYPNVPNLGDMRKLRHEQSRHIDLLVGGTPCQSFSINGMRRGMDDDRGNLTLQYCRILDEFRPRWFVWENVPNVMRTNNGRDFGTFLGALGQLGYRFAYRVLDARGFGLPQRRKRVFVVGHARSWRYAASVLFDGGSVGNHRTSAAEARGQHNSGPCGKNRVIGWTGDTTPKFGQGVLPTIRAEQGGEGIGVLIGDTMRRLTESELERAMGLPVGHTEITYRDKPASYSARKRAIGNSFCVPILRWIGGRIHHLETTDV